MSDIAIKVEGLGKRYRIGELQKYKALRDTLTDALYAPFRAISSIVKAQPSKISSQPSNNFIWALKDITYEIKHGEVVGIIGRNGAGKSTLLKILSRIIEPTEGYAELHGRVGSLLEVGTGFHPELTGRENIYLNGAILGMRKAEINRKFDEIVAFAEVEKFIDTPVKFYSSGMYVRLAFAVAAHLEPEILLVDEVLAVGDVAFQKKCLGKMNNVAKEGRTVLFVSHNMAAVESLTHRCLLLGSGSLILEADTRTAISQYLKQNFEHQNIDIRHWKERIGSKEAIIVRFATLSSDGAFKQVFRPGEPVKILVGVEFYTPMVADLGIAIETATEKALFASHLSDFYELEKWAGYKEFVLSVTPNHLRHGKYLVSIAVFSKNMQQFHDVVYHFPAFDIEGTSESQYCPLDARWGELYFNLPWEVKQ